MVRRRWNRPVGALIAAAVLIAGCSSDDDDTTSTTEAAPETTEASPETTEEGLTGEGLDLALLTGHQPVQRFECHRNLARIIGSR